MLRTSRYASIALAALGMFLAFAAPSSARGLGCYAPGDSYGGLIASTSAVGGYWRLGETSGSGVMCDSSGNNNLNYQGAVTLGQSGALRRSSDTASSFDGTTGYVTGPSGSGLNPTLQISVELWARPSVTQSRTLLRKNLQYGLRLNGTSVVARLWKPDGSIFEVSSPANTIVPGIWQQIAFTYDGQSVVLYVNGQNVAAAPLTGMLPTGLNNALLLATSRSGSDYFAGGLDEVAIYGVALSASQIATHYGVATGTTNLAPGAPAWAVASAEQSTATLQWGTSADDDLAGYRIYRQDPDGSWPATPLATTDAATHSYDDGGLDLNTKYTYRVGGYDRAGQEGPLSAATSATPSQPVIPARSPGCPAPSDSYGGLAVATARLASYWRLDDAPGATWACDAAGTSDGSYQGGVVLGATGSLPGGADTAATFDGTSGYVTISSTRPLNPNAQVTVEAWVRPSTMQSTTIVRKNLQYGLRLSGSAFIARVWSPDGINYTDVSSPINVLTPNVWQQLTFTYDNHDIVLYANGQRVAAQALSDPLPASNNPLLIATSRSGSDYFAGSLDEVAVYGIALTSDQIAARYAVAGGALNIAPGAPAWLTANSAAGAVTLSWSASPDDDLASYSVYRQNADGGWPTMPIATTAADTRTFSDDGLSNGTTYDYRITGTDTAGQQGRASWYAAATPTPLPPASSGDPVIAAAGDMACDPADPGFAGGLGRAADCAQLRTSNLLVSDPLTAVLALGDNQYEDNTLSAFEQSLNPSWGRVKALTHPAIGNHEYQTRNANGYFDYYNGVDNQSGPAGDRTTGYFSFDVGAWHLIALNSNCARVGGCGAGSSQEQWLKNDLAAHPSTCTLAYWHWGLYDAGGVGNNTQMTQIWQDLYDAGADLVLAAHDHNYQRFARQDAHGNVDHARGVREFIVGTGGRNLTRLGSPVAATEIQNDSTFGVLRLTLHSGGYDWSFVPTTDGAFTDSGTETCHG